MNKYPAFTIVINRHAASGRSRYSLRVVTKQLKNRHLTYRICSTPKDGAEQLLCDLINNQELKYSIPLIMGGDGTLNQAINGIKKSSYPQTALAYIPAGSGNDFANALNIPQHQEVRALEQIIDAVIPQTINLGKIQFQNQVRFFINNIG
ncbi:hypothetical protein EQ500_12750, partial [Lactobacillus sp. XV13L]|nr:hypothetical protein [Lactobacillus sp. XV13L]